MENDKQINSHGLGNVRDLEQTKRFFLSEELLAKGQKPEVYSLADEYAKSKRNKSFLVYFLVLSYIAAIGIGVFFIDRLEENRNKRIEVNIAEFRQFNLMELLMEQKENEEKLVKLQQELEDLRASSKKELEKLSPQAQQKVMATANEKIKKLEEAYNQEIKSRQEVIAALQKTIAAEKQKMGDKTQASTGIENANKNINTSTISIQFQEAAMEKVKAEYEAKIEKLKVEYDAKIAKMETDYADKNESLNADHRKELNDVKKENEKLKNDYINGYNFALSYLSTTRGENGYVIDARDPKRLIVFINHSYSVKKGDVGFVYKNEDVAVAKVEFIPERGRIIARVVSMLRADKIEPFDKILLKLVVSQ